MYGGPFISRKIMRAPIQPSDVAICSILWFESFSLKMKIFQNRLTEPLWLIMDSGLVIVTFITVVYIIIMFSLLFYVKYEWCDLLFKNNTVGYFLYSFYKHKTLQWNYIDYIEPDWTSIESFLGCQKCQRNNIWKFLMVYIGFKFRIHDQMLFC